MEEDDANHQQGGGVAAGIRILFLSRGAGGAALWIGDLGGPPAAWERPWVGFSTRFQDG